MPFDPHPGKKSPIEVFEDDTHFLVRIHPENRERAKKIPGRQWDGNRKLWVYRKDQPTYEALVEEFQKDADKFDIRRPKTQRPPGIQPPVKEPDDSEFDDQILNIDNSQSKINSELEQIREMLNYLKDGAVNQGRILEELYSNQTETTKMLAKFELPVRQTVKTQKIEVIPDNLNLNKPKEIELLEKTLIRVACLTAKEQPSFCDWVNQYCPLGNPTVFVIRTHEHLKKQLGKIVGDEDSRIKFAALIDRASNEKLIYYDEKKLADKPIQILRTLNAHRNSIGHSDLNQWEEWSRSILYLMNLALVWSKVVMEEDNFEVEEK